jgi:hypothetical protein
MESTMQGRAATRLTRVPSAASTLWPCMRLRLSAAVLAHAVHSIAWRYSLEWRALECEELCGAASRRAAKPSC